MPVPITWNEIIKSSAISYVNHFLTLAFAYLTQHGLRQPEILNPANMLVLAGAIVAGLASLGMVIYRRATTHNVIETARNAPAGTSIGIIKTEAAELPKLPQ